MLSTLPSSISQETHVTPLYLTLAGLALGSVGALFAAAVYTEAHRAPDQP